MTRLDALKALAEKVEAGEWAVRSVVVACFGDQSQRALSAFDGYLEAAQAMHEAVLPGWAVERISSWPGSGATVHLWGTHEERGGRWHSAEDGRVEASAETIARAWLLAILRALIAQEAAE